MVEGPRLMGLTLILALTDNRPEIVQSVENTIWADQWPED